MQFKVLVVHMPASDYSLPVSRLLNIGRPKTIRRGQWPNYIETYGLTDEHIPDLIELAVEDSLDWGNDIECYAPIHACRALGQLKAEAAIHFLVGLLEDRDNDWFAEELPIVFGMIGSASIPSLTSYLNSSDADSWGRVTASGGLEQIANAHPEHRDRCVAIITDALTRHQQQPPELNGNLVGRLLDLQAVDSADVIERAYNEGPMDEMICGSWAQVQVELGLASADDFTDEELQPQQPEWIGSIQVIAALKELAQEKAQTVVRPIADGTSLSQFGKGSLAPRKRKSSQHRLGFGSPEVKEKKPRKR